MPDPAAPAAEPTIAGEARAPRAPTLAHRLEYAALRGAIGGLGTLPWTQATAVGAWLGRIGYAPAGVRRGVVERQIAAAFPEFTPERVREVARASYESLGRTTIEAALVPRLGRAGLVELFERVEGWDLLEEARARGRGAIVVTGHLGNWELGGSYIAARGVPIDGIVRQQANPLFDRFLTDTRQRMGVEVVWDGHAVRRTPRSLRENRVVGMISDQGALGLASTWVPFFGRPAKTPRGPAVFALRMGVPILFAAALRLPNGRFRLVVEPVPFEQTGDRNRDVEVIVAAYTQSLERWVRAHPEQYFWQHRRWKHQPPDTPPHLREP
jgi:KDO2-lipid IV(A) lauroyltransferase